MAGPVDPTLHSRIAGMPVLREPHYAVLRQFAGANLPERTGTAAYHADLACLFAAVLCAMFDFDLKPKAKRHANIVGYRNDMSVIAFAQTILHLSHYTGNDELLTGRNCEHIVDLLGRYRPEMAEPVRLQLAGAEVFEQGRVVANLLLQACERNGLKTKTEHMTVLMMIPTNLRMCRDGVADDLGVTIDELVKPIQR